MIERGIMEALHGAKPGSKQEFSGQALLSMLKAVKAAGFKDPATPEGLESVFVEADSQICWLPEGAVRLPDISTVGFANSKKLEGMLDSTKDLNVRDWAREVIERAPVSLEEPQTLSLAVLSARTMGLSDDHPTTKRIWERAKKYGDRVSVEVMVKLAIEAAKGNVAVEIGKPLVGIMEPVTDSRGDPSILYIRRHGNELGLLACYVNSNDWWDPGFRFVISSRK